MPCFESGDAQPYQDSHRVFVGMYRVQGRQDFRTEFSTVAGTPAVSGSPLRVSTYRYDAG